LTHSKVKTNRRGNKLQHSFPSFDVNFVVENLLSVSVPASELAATTG